MQEGTRGVAEVEHFPDIKRLNRRETPRILTHENTSTFLNFHRTQVHSTKLLANFKSILKMSGFPKLIPAFTTHVSISMLMPPSQDQSRTNSNSNLCFFPLQDDKTGILCKLGITRAAFIKNGTRSRGRSASREEPSKVCPNNLGYGINF
jgi:hypothetical protein